LLDLLSPAPRHGQAKICRVRIVLDEQPVGAQIILPQQAVDQKIRRLGRDQEPEIVETPGADLGARELLGMQDRDVAADPAPPRR
jgi:hypothetical protein